MIRKKKNNLGVGFADELTKVSSKGGYFKTKEDTEWKEIFLPNFDPKEKSDLDKSTLRPILFICISIILFFILSLRLFHLQAADGRKNRELADGNRIQIKTIHASRGIIYDRNEKILASNSPGFRLIDNESKRSIFISREEALELEVKNDPRINNLEVDSVRKYPQGEELAHVIGYVGEVSQEEIDKSVKQLRSDITSLKGLTLNKSLKPYKVGDRIGKSGVESSFEEILRGKDGGEIIEIDSQGKQIRSLRTIQAIPGQSIYLTIDADLQSQVYRLLKEGIKRAGVCCGSAIAMDPNNGQILALVSIPSFDNNVFTNSYDSEELEEILTRSDSPTLNRSISGTYPPGSTFKIVSSLAAIASGKMNAKTQIEDTGEMFLGPYRFVNWYFTQYGKTEGLVDLTKALKRSNDTYYYHVAERVGEKALIEWAKKLHLGDGLGIDLPGEEKGLIADNEWKEKNIGQSWYPGDTLHMAIGQGFVLTTPLQILGLTSFVASDGVLYKPQSLLKIVKDENTILHDFEPQILVSNLISKDDLKPIKKGLSEVTKEGGTAWPFISFPIPTSGKTGTAEYGDATGKTHAWYTLYAPSDDPKIALTLLVEGGGEGSSVAAPITKEILRWYFSQDKNNLIEDIYQPPTEAVSFGE